MASTCLWDSSLNTLRLAKEARDRLLRMSHRLRSTNSVSTLPLNEDLLTSTYRQPQSTMSFSSSMSITWLLSLTLRQHTEVMYSALRLVARWPSKSQTKSNVMRNSTPSRQLIEKLDRWCFTKSLRLFIETMLKLILMNREDGLLLLMELRRIRERLWNLVRLLRRVLKRLTRTNLS